MKWGDKESKVLAPLMNILFLMHNLTPWHLNKRSWIQLSCLVWVLMPKHAKCTDLSHLCLALQVVLLAIKWVTLRVRAAPDQFKWQAGANALHVSAPPNVRCAIPQNNTLQCSLTSVVSPVTGHTTLLKMAPWWERLKEKICWWIGMPPFLSSQVRLGHQQVELLAHKFLSFKNHS